jgi:hypothetical protein
MNMTEILLVSIGSDVALRAGSMQAAPRILAVVSS